MIKWLYYSLKMSEFEFLFRTNTLAKGMSPSYPLVMG